MQFVCAAQLGPIKDSFGLLLESINSLGNSGSPNCSADAHEIDDDKIVVTTAMAVTSRHIIERLAMIVVALLTAYSRA